MCLPKDLPEYFEVDISGLELDEMLHVSDLTVPEGVEIPELALGPEHDHPIVSIHIIKVAVIEEEIEEVAVEGEEVEGEEGEAVADGEAADEASDKGESKED